MRNAIALAFLAVLAVPTSGCDSDATPRQANAPQLAPRPPLSDGRYLVDAERNRVWLLTHEGVFIHDVSRPERVAVSLPAWVWAGEPYACPPDLALGPRGEAVITSNVLPTVWRVDPDSFAVSVHPLELDAERDKDVGFSGLVYSRQHGAFLATSETQGSLWKIDPLLTKARKVPLSGPIPEACGLALRPRSAHQALSRLVDLCVRTRHGGWSVVFAPDWRSAYVSAAPCSEDPGPLAATGSNGK